MSQFNPVITKRTPSDTVFAELFLSPGPQAVGVTGQNRLQDFVGQEWMLLVDKETREVQLWQENGSWLRVDVPGHPLIGGVAPVGARRFALCFDQAATPVVAYELDGVIRVTRWDAVQQQYIQNVSFAGVDPTLQLDAVWAGDIPGSDVLLFYLTPDRTGVRVRVQRDLYAVENQVWDYPQPVILDRVISAPLRYQVLVSSADGRALPDVLLSGFYPYTSGDGAQAVGRGPTEGAYRPVAIPLAPDPDIIGALGFGPTAGAYISSVMTYDPLADSLGVVGGGPGGGAYIEAVIHAGPFTGAAQGAGAGPTGGEYELVTIRVPPVQPVSTFAAGAGPTGGEYEAA